MQPDDLIRKRARKIVDAGDVPKATLQESITLNEKVDALIEEVKKKDLLEYDIQIDEDARLHLKGDKGETGDPGIDGVDGKDGVNGIDGKNGIDGLDGSNGKDGVDGIDGLDGKDGKDAVLGDIKISDVKELPETIATLQNRTQLLNQMVSNVANSATSGGATTFTDLTDVPNSYAGANGKVVAVNAGQTGLEFISVGGTGTVTSVTSANADISVANTTTTPILTLNSATVATASTIVKRDADANLLVNNYFANTASTVSAGGTTVLTVASARTQNLTGSSTQTFQLPNATTLSLSSIFEFNNNSSSSLIITNASAATQYTVPAGGAVQCFCTNIGTANGTWDFHALAPQAVTWSSGITGLVMNSVLSTTPSVGSGASSSTTPSFIPQRGASTTGFGGDGNDLHGTIAGVARLTISATGITATNLSGTNTGDQTPVDSFGIVVDGAGTAITTGSKGTKYIPWDCTITGWDIRSDISGSCVFNVKRAGVSLAGTEKPTLSASSSNSDLALSTWTTSLLAGDVVEFVVDSASTLTRATVTILVSKL